MVDCICAGKVSLFVTGLTTDLLASEDAIHAVY